MAKNVTCPACFTKMRSVGHDLVCPTCGYKYCEGHAPYTYDDHDHNDYKSYNQKTSYGTGYANSGTSTQSASQSSYAANTGSGVQNASRSSYANSGSGTQSASRNSYANSGSGTQSASRSSYANSGLGTQSVSQGSYAAQRNQNLSARPSRKPPKNTAVKVIFFIIFLYFINILIGFSIFRGFLNDSSDDSSFPEASTSLDTGNKGNNKGTSGTKTASELLDSYKKNKEPQTLVQDLLVYLFEKDLDQITLADCSQIIGLNLYPNENGDLAVDLLWDDGSEDSFQSTYQTCDLSELKLFTSLEEFYADTMTNIFFAPGDLDGLTNLVYLECSNTPAELAKIIDPLQLQALMLSSQETFFDVAGIDAYQNLYYLDVFADGLRNAEGIGKISNLSFLRVDVIGHPTSWDFLESLENLRTLQIYSPYLSDLTFLRGMQNLTSLTVSGAKHLFDVSPITNCPNLTVLSLSDDNFIQDFSPIGKLTGLESLYLYSCDLQDISWIGTLQKLQYLIIPDNNVKDLSPLNDLPNLEGVYCSGNPITNGGGLQNLSLIMD